MKDPYETLGVSRTASAKEIRAAYRKLAKENHPDLHPGDKAAESRFKEISAAYAILGDEEMRRRYDAGEIDATGAERPQQHEFYRTYADADSPFHTQEGFASAEDLEEFLAQAFGGFRGARGTRRRTEFRARGADLSYSLQVSFLEAANGATKTVTLPDGKTLNVTIPEGTEDRQTLRLKGQGGPGFGGGPPGDAYIEVHVQPHAFFERKDNNVHVTVPVTLKEAVLGAKIEVPTVRGVVSMTIPKNSNTGDTLRLRGQGIKDRRSGQMGHQYVKLKVVLPEGEEPELARFLESWTPKDQRNPRREMLR